MRPRKPARTCASAEEALAEYRRDGGGSGRVSSSGSLAAETKATYEPDEA